MSGWQRVSLTLSVKKRLYCKGLKMTDIDAYIDGIKLNWVKRLTEDTCVT